MPNNAIIRADGSGDYTSIIAWEAAEQEVDYGSVTVGRVDGFFDQGSSALVINGTWPNGARLEPFDSADAFDGTARNLCGLRSTNNTRCINHQHSTPLTVDGLEIIYAGGSGTDRCLQDSGSGAYTYNNCLIVTETNARIWVNNFTFNDCVIVSEATTNNMSNGSTCTINRCNFFANNTQDIAGSTYTQCVGYNKGTGDDFSGTASLTNCASTDATADLLTNIVIADNFVDPDPIVNKDYRIKSGSPLDTNNIGAFVEVGGVTYEITIESGNVQFSDSTSELIKDSQIIIGEGNISLAGEAFNLLKDSQLVTDVGDIDLLGVSIDLLKQAQLELTIDEGALAYVGNNLSTLKDSYLPINTGDISITGNGVATLKNSQLTIGVGNSNFVGESQSLIVGHVMQIQAGNIQLEGQPIELEKIEVTLPDGSLYTLNIVGGEIDLFGNSVTTIKDSILPIETGIVAFVSSPLGVLVDRCLQIDIGVFDFIGEELGTLKDSILEIDTGEINFIDRSLALEYSGFVAVRLDGYSIAYLPLPIMPTYAKLPIDLNYSKQPLSVRYRSNN